MERHAQMTGAYRRHKKKKTEPGPERSRWEKFLEAPLCLHTVSQIYCFRLKDLGSGCWSWNPGTYQNDLKHPPPVQIFDFYAEGFPIGMGSFKWGSDWYMIGGEMVQTGTNIYKEDRFNVQAITDITYKGSSRSVFLLKLSSSDTLSLKPSRNIPPMQEGKARPLVLSTEGKIYVFHRSSVFLPRFASTNLMSEGFDKSKKGWAVAANIPLEREHERFKWPRLNGLFVIGCKLYMDGRNGNVICFDASNGTWDSESRFISNIKSSFRKARVHLPFDGGCVSGYPGFHLMFCLQLHTCLAPKPVAVLIHEDGALYCCQDLSEELFVGFLPYLDCVMVQSRFLDLGDGIVCAIIYGPHYCDKQVLLHICIFEVEFLAVDISSHSAPEKKIFLKLNVLKNYFCNMTAIGQYIMLGLLNAFFLQDVVAERDGTNEEIQTAWNLSLPPSPPPKSQ